MSERTPGHSTFIGTNYLSDFHPAELLSKSLCIRPKIAVYISSFIQKDTEFSVIYSEKKN